jgi:phosphoribosylanthranilate isomerase
MSKPRIKICGITQVDDALLAARLGADAIGLNFCRASKRFIDFERADTILDALPPLVEPVAVVVNASLEALDRLAGQLGKIRTVQWHGDDPPLLVEKWYRFIPAFAVVDSGSLARVKAYLDRARAAGRAPTAIMLDGHAPGHYGGTGQPAPWQLLADFDPGVPVILAGGLTPENVAEAIAIVRPFAVDVASGVESEPGRKDPDKMRRFIEAVRAC